MINKGKLYSYQNARFFKQTSQWRRKSWWCNLPAALILWHAGSDVMGCRRPTGGVFKYVSSDTSHAEAFPVATPRGRSSSSHEGEQMFTVSCTMLCYDLKIVIVQCMIYKPHHITSLIFWHGNLCLVAHYSIALATHQSRKTQVLIKEAKYLYKYKMHTSFRAIYWTLNFETTTNAIEVASMLIFFRWNWTHF